MTVIYIDADLARHTAEVPASTAEAAVLYALNVLGAVSAWIAR